ncbi:MAG: hypothetical protein LCH96_07830 [Actinobacteria bacterium]|nr:hypothetical protein [Actinomycetota bacterium]
MTRPDVSTAEPASPPAGFSVHEFARTARGSHRAELDLDAYATRPLEAGALEMVALLERLERGALSYLRSVLVTPTHKDARVTGFLVTWAYEKFWVADALELIVAAHPDFVPATADAPKLRAARHALAERLEPIRESVVANLIGDDVVAVHCAAGAIDEWITATAYERLAEFTDHPVFAATMTRLRDVKRRHDTYFTDEARRRLAASPAAGRLARRRLRRASWPLGAVDEPPPLVARLLGGLVIASDLVDLDARVDALPGLAGLDLVTTAAQGARKAAAR